MIRRWLLSLLALAPLAGQGLSDLPDWVRPHALATQTEQAPEGADAWVLLERTEVGYRGDGEVQTRHLRLVKILTDRGRSEARFMMVGLDGGASKVLKLKGWNLRPSGEVIRVEHDKVMSFEGMGLGRTFTATELAGVEKGSLIAFEALEASHSPQGPNYSLQVMEDNPVRRWELEPLRQAGWFHSLKEVEIIGVDRHHFEPWLTPGGALGEAGIALDRVPAKPKDEGHRPPDRNVLPWVSVRFLDRALADVPSYRDWDAFAQWQQARFAERETAPALPGLTGTPVERLAQLLDWMARQLQRKAVYLTPERNWLPQAADEVGRLRYGDCKDLTCFLAAASRSLGFQAYPAFTCVVEGRVEAGEPPGPAFNHVLTAVRLDRSLGLPAEVETPGGRFLLIDPTDRFTPLGRLPEVHRGGRVLICTPEGGHWVQVPEGAIPASRVTVTLKGRADARGALHAAVTLKEEGQGWGLRAAAQGKGQDAFRTLLLAQDFILPPTARLKVASEGEPMDLSRPFVLELELDHPEGLKASGHEVALAPLGWKIVPSPVQKPGVPRRLPVSQGTEADLEITCEVTSPLRLGPVLPEQRGDTPFRAFSWTAQASREAEGTRLVLHLAHHTRHADFGFDRLEEGVAASRKDRAQALEFMADALAFKVLPGP